MLVEHFPPFNYDTFSNPLLFDFLVGPLFFHLQKQSLPRLVFEYPSRPTLNNMSDQSILRISRVRLAGYTNVFLV